MAKRKIRTTQQRLWGQSAALVLLLFFLAGVIAGWELHP